jgi:hypothetical protein
MPACFAVLAVIRRLDKTRPNASDGGIPVFQRSDRVGLKHLGLPVLDAGRSLDFYSTYSALIRLPRSDTRTGCRSSAWTRTATRSRSTGKRDPQRRLAGGRGCQRKQAGTEQADDLPWVGGGEVVGLDEMPGDGDAEDDGSGVEDARFGATALLCARTGPECGHGSFYGC